MIRELESRLRELAQYRCDPRMEFRAHELASQSTADRTERRRPFDLGKTSGEGLTLSNMPGLIGLWRPCARSGSSEVVGSPNVSSTATS